MKSMWLALGLLITSFSALAADLSNGADNFYTSEQVTVAFDALPAWAQNLS